MKSRERKIRTWTPSIKRMRLWEELKDVPIVMLFEPGEFERIVMDYLDRKDKNGVEICEGDIVRAANGVVYEIVFGEYESIECEALQDGAVQCHGLGFFFRRGSNYILFASFNGSGQGYEVLGNIYQNPELLVEVR